MKSKKSLQKVLCAVLVAASVSSVAAPVSYAGFSGFALSIMQQRAHFTTTFRLADGRVVAEVDLSLKECANKADARSGVYENSEVLAEFRKTAGIKEGVPGEIIAFTWPSRRNVLRLLFVPAGQDLAALAKSVWASAITLSDSEVFATERPIDQTGGVVGPNSARIVDLKFVPIAIEDEAKHGVANGLLGMQRDIILRLCELMTRPTDDRAGRSGDTAQQRCPRIAAVPCVLGSTAEAFFWLPRFAARRSVLLSLAWRTTPAYYIMVCLRDELTDESGVSVWPTRNSFSTFAGHLLLFLDRRVPFSAHAPQLIRHDKARLASLIHRRVSGRSDAVYAQDRAKGARLAISVRVRRCEAAVNCALLLLKNRTDSGEITLAVQEIKKLLEEALKQEKEPEHPC
ncbi:hypothetical protein FACS189481_1950 [Clostridia bacterium]|nr:hypothetical protein FACS189481_1950 [Clostridia bacterium]